MEWQGVNGRAGRGKRNSQPTYSQPQKGAVGAVAVLVEVAGRGEERGVPAW